MHEINTEKYKCTKMTNTNLIKKNNFILQNMLWLKNNQRINLI